MKVTNNKLGLASSVYTVTHMYYTRTYIHISQLAQRSNDFPSVYSVYTPHGGVDIIWSRVKSQIHTLTSMLYKYICSHQCCTNTYAHINAVQIHMLTSMLYRPMSLPHTPPHNHKHTAIRMPVLPFPPLPLSHHKPSPVN